MKSGFWVFALYSLLIFACLGSAVAVAGSSHLRPHAKQITKVGSNMSHSRWNQNHARSLSSVSEDSQKVRHVVILLHGIGKGSFDMAAMSRGLRRQGFAVYNWNYPSTKFTLDSLADQLKAVVDQCSSMTVDFVTHSMGGIVVRTYLSKYHPKNIGRLVMIAPPNQGAQLADMLGNLTLYKMILGPAGQELRQGAAGDCASAGIPGCEFGIIAGGTGRSIGFNPILPGDNDGTVTVESTRLCGAKDFILVPYMHPMIQMMPKTIGLTGHFLQTGKFTNGETHPILDPDSTPNTETASAKPSETKGPVLPNSKP